MANLKLTQYLVRLKFEDVKKVPKKKRPIKIKEKKVVDKDGSDFDSEAEYGKEDGNDSEGSYEMDDGKTKLKSEEEAAAGGREDDNEEGAESDFDEEGELSMSEGEDSQDDKDEKMD